MKQPTTGQRNLKNQFACEGDLISIQSGVIFDVKGLIHPPGKVIAFPRYIPSNEGTRRNKEHQYNKIYSLNERFVYLQQNQPDLIIFDSVFDETLCEVPIEQITKLYKPTEKLAQLRSAKNLTALEQKALTLAEDLKEASGIPWSAIGISGSVMAGLTTENSDIDPLVYGETNSRKAYGALESLQQNSASRFKSYSKAELTALFEFRSKDTQMSFQDFEKVENRKAFQGKFLGTDYFVRFVKDYSEINECYGDVCYRNSGYAKITATVLETGDALFTPCTYQIGEVQVQDGPKLAPIKEIVSFRGRFCQQAVAGEKVYAQGKVERVASGKEEAYYRLIIGGKPSDYMVLKS
jgi:uncharacterized protein